MKPLLILVTLLLISFFGLREPGIFKKEPPVQAPILLSSTTSTYRVLSVIDGDTIKVEKDGETETVRLLGIDTPEVDPQYNPIECYGREATNATKGKLLNQTVTLETDSSQGKRDKFERILAYVFLADGTNVNQYLVAEGFAKEYTYSDKYLYQSEFRAAEEAAKINQKGLWSPGLCPENT